MKRRLTVLLAVVAVVVVGWFAGRQTRPNNPPDAPRSAAPIPTGHAPLAPPVLATPAPTPSAATPQVNPLAVGPDDDWHPRPADEWQGMRVDMSMRQRCETSDQCGFALACLDDGQCGPCETDSHCDRGEACVLDHCVPAANVACRGRADCAGAGRDALCIMNGLTGGEPRGNSGLASFCQSPWGGTEQDETAMTERRAARLAATSAQVRPPVPAADLAARLDAELAVEAE